MQETYVCKRHIDNSLDIVYQKTMEAVFPGSFDPPTLGHINIIERASSLFERLVVVLAENRRKGHFFPIDERLAMLKELVTPWKNVSVVVWDSLIAEYLKKNHIRILIRGIRGMEDFSYEFEVSMMNKGLYPQIETFFIPTDPKYIVLRSSSIREVASFHGDVSAMVPEIVANALKERFAREDQLIKKILPSC